MSTLVVEVTTIDDIMPHPNADRLELAIVKGWNCVVPKGVYNKGDRCVYIPIDSVLPDDLLEKLFSTAKIKPSNRIKTIRLRGAISQGLVASIDSLNLPKDIKIGTNVKNKLKIEKYEPPVHGGLGSMRQPKKRYCNSNFNKYTSIENFQNYNNLFKEGEEVVITEKIHGSNFRAGWVRYDANTIKRKILKFLRLAPKYEFVFGSHNVQLDNKLLRSKEYNAWAFVVNKYDLKDKIPKGAILYGEIYGPGIQKNYAYGAKEVSLVVFDLKLNKTYLDPENLFSYCRDFGLRAVPIIYKGPFNLEKTKSLLNGNSILCSEQKVREGVVIKPEKEDSTYVGRKILKYINPEYLLKDNTEYH